MFINSLKDTLNNDIDYNVSETENGALGYRTTGTELVDINFQVSFMRNMSEGEIVNKFTRAFYENKLLAIKWLFFVRDVREGMGERRLFRFCISYLARTHKDIVREIYKLIPEYGRWDDTLVLLDTDLRDEVVDFYIKVLEEDLVNAEENKPISLLAKWLPSFNASAKQTKIYARIILSSIQRHQPIFWESPYQKLLSYLRGYLKIVERDMSAKRFDEIDYSRVPSRANLLYKDAFLRNDEERRKAYLDSLEKGETKINAGVLLPHDIVHKYISGCYRGVANDYDITLEELWKALPDYVNGNGNTICVADGSASMGAMVGSTDISALSVANSLAIYFSERCSGEFKDKYITFSNTPQLVDFSNTKSLKEKIELAYYYNEVSNTNIEAVFKLILKTAKKNEIKQEDMPTNILILSDMEFDSATSGRTDIRLFDELSIKYQEAGYKLPRLVFWNILSRTGTIPVKENDLGVALVSGFSPTVVKMVLSETLDPYDCLLEQLNSDRYKPIEDALREVI